MSFVRQPIVVALVLIVLLLYLGEALSPGFATGGQILRLLIVASLLGIVAAGQNVVILGGREGIDLSVGGVVSLSAILAGNVMLSLVAAGVGAALLPRSTERISFKGVRFAPIKGLQLPALPVAAIARRRPRPLIVDTVLGVFNHSLEAGTGEENRIGANKLTTACPRLRARPW